VRIALSASTQSAYFSKGNQLRMDGETEYEDRYCPAKGALNIVAQVGKQGSEILLVNQEPQELKVIWEDSEARQNEMMYLNDARDDFAQARKKLMIFIPLCLLGMFWLIRQLARKARKPGPKTETQAETKPASEP
jgi:hypothetical protein